MATRRDSGNTWKGGKGLAKNDELIRMTKRLQSEAKALRDKAKRMEEEARDLYTKADRVDQFVKEMDA